MDKRSSLLGLIIINKGNFLITFTPDLSVAHPGTSRRWPFCRCRRRRGRDSL